MWRDRDWDAYTGTDPHTPTYKPLHPGNVRNLRSDVLMCRGPLSSDTRQLFTLQGPLVNNVRIPNFKGVKHIGYAVTANCRGAMVQRVSVSKVVS